MAEMTTVKLGGALGKRFGKTHRFCISSPGEAIRALSSQLEGFAGYLSDPERKTLYRVFVAEKEINAVEELHDLLGSTRREPNTSLGPTQVHAQGRPVPLIYGEVLAGSAVISSGISVADTNR